MEGKLAFRMSKIVTSILTASKVRSVMIMRPVLREWNMALNNGKKLTLIMIAK